MEVKQTFLPFLTFYFSEKFGFYENWQMADMCVVNSVVGGGAKRQINEQILTFPIENFGFNGDEEGPFVTYVTYVE